MRALIFAKTGQVARELARLVPDGASFDALGRSEVDLTRPSTCADIIRTNKPDVVINAAAYTAVDQAEDDEATAKLINGDAPGAMAAECAALNIPFLHISTDYVFDGTGNTPWNPDARIGPLGAYGRTKADGETQIRQAGGRHVILRTSWVFSAHGGNFVKTMLGLAKTRSSLTIVADQIGAPTAAHDIAAALWSIAQQMTDSAQAGGTYHFASVPNVSWADFAREIFAQSAQQMTVVDIPSSDFPTPAPRPANSRLDCSTLAADFGIAQPDWKKSLTDVLAELTEVAS